MARRQESTGVGGGAVWRRRGVSRAYRDREDEIVLLSISGQVVWSVGEQSYAKPNTKLNKCISATVSQTLIQRGPGEQRVGGVMLLTLSAGFIAAVICLCVSLYQLSEVSS